MWCTSGPRRRCASTRSWLPSRSRLAGQPIRTRWSRCCARTDIGSRSRNAGQAAGAGCGLRRKPQDHLHSGRVLQLSSRFRPERSSSPLAGRLDCRAHPAVARDVHTADGADRLHRRLGAAKQEQRQQSHQWWSTLGRRPARLSVLRRCGPSIRGRARSSIRSCARPSICRCAGLWVCLCAGSWIWVRARPPVWRRRLSLRAYRAIWRR